MSDAERTAIGGTAVAIDGRGLLLTGPAGSGKSELAFSLIERGARLVADDMVLLRPDGARLLMDAPAAGIGRLALRDIGIIMVAHMDRPVPLSLVVRLDVTTPPAAGGPRLDQIAPVPGVAISIPQLTLNPATPAAPAKLALALDRWGL